MIRTKFFTRTSLTALLIIVKLNSVWLHAQKTPPQPTATTESHLKLFAAAQSAFKRNCHECHGPTKQKGNYRLDLKRAAFTAGKSEQVPIKPGNPYESELIYRIQLPVDDDDVMPPKKKGRVSPKDLKAITEWVTSGAHWPDEDAIRQAPGEYVEIGNPATNKLIEQTNQTGSKAEYNAWGDESVRVELSFVHEGKLNSALQTLIGFGDQLTWLDCGQLELPKDFFKQLGQFKNLQRLHLDSSNVSDADLKILLQLPKLNYLNLYNTSISDAAIPTLKKCTALKKLYLADSQVTQQAATQLKSDRPELVIVYQ